MSHADGEHLIVNLPMSTGLYSGYLKSFWNSRRHPFQVTYTICCMGFMRSQQPQPPPPRAQGAFRRPGLAPPVRRPGPGARGGGVMLLAADEAHAANRLRDLERVPSTVPKNYSGSLSIGP